MSTICDVPTSRTSEQQALKALGEVISQASAECVVAMSRWAEAASAIVREIASSCLLYPFPPEPLLQRNQCGLIHPVSRQGRQLRRVRRTNQAQI